MNRYCSIILATLLLSQFGCNEQPRGSQQPANTVRGTSSMVKVRYKQYEDRVDLAGRNIIAVSGASRASAKELFPFLVEPSAMNEREFSTQEVTAMNGDIADEVHEFTNATQGTYKIKRLLLRNGEVIELTVSFH